MANSFYHFLIDCMDPRTQYGQGFLYGVVLSTILEMIKAWRNS